MQFLNKVYSEEKFFPIFDGVKIDLARCLQTIKITIKSKYLHQLLPPSIRYQCYS